MGHDVLKEAFDEAFKGHDTGLLNYENFVELGEYAEIDWDVSDCDMRAFGAVLGKRAFECSLRAGMRACPETRVAVSVVNGRTLASWYVAGCTVAEYKGKFNMREQPVASPSAELALILANAKKEHAQDRIEELREKVVEMRRLLDSIIDTKNQRST